MFSAAVRFSVEHFQTVGLHKANVLSTNLWVLECLSSVAAERLINSYFIIYLLTFAYVCRCKHLVQSSQSKLPAGPESQWQLWSLRDREQRDGMGRWVVTEMSQIVIHYMKGSLTVASKDHKKKKVSEETCLQTFILNMYVDAVLSQFYFSAWQM